MNSSYCVFVTYLYFRITTSNRVFSSRKAFRPFIFHIPNPGGTRLEDKEWSSSPVLLSSGAAHGKQQKKPRAGTAAAEDLSLLNPLAHNFLIPNTHTSFVLLFLRLGLQIHTHQVNRHRQIYQVEQHLLTSSRCRQQN